MALREIPPPVQEPQNSDNHVSLLLCPNQVYRKLEEAARLRGMTVVQLLAAAVDHYLLVTPPK